MSSNYTDSKVDKVDINIKGLQLQKYINNLEKDADIYFHKLIEKGLQNKLNNLRKKCDMLLNKNNKLKENINELNKELNSYNDNNMTIFTFIRHSESYFNVWRDNNPKINSMNTKYIHLLNCGITNKGMFESIKLNFHFDILIVSPLKRCLETLKYSNIKYDKLIINELFREYKIDICDFFDYEDINIIESEKELLLRLKKCKEYLKSNPIFKNKSIGIITHGDFIYHLTNFKHDLNNSDFIHMVNISD